MILASISARRGLSSVHHFSSCRNLCERGTDSSPQRCHFSHAGEPKSGTGFMFEWAGNLLIHTCDYLNETFGDGSCRIHLGMSDDNIKDLREVSLTFEPNSGSNRARCSCPDVYR